MNHNILITVDGYSWNAVATTHHNGKQREVSAISCIDVPLQVLASLADHLIEVHDVLEVVRNYLNDTATVKREATCGPIEISWYPLDPVMLRDDLTGLTYAVKLVDCHGNTHEYNTGASGSWQAMDICKAVLQKPIRSSAVTPLGY